MNSGTRGVEQPLENNARDTIAIAASTANRKFRLLFMPRPVYTGSSPTSGTSRSPIVTSPIALPPSSTIPTGACDRRNSATA